MSIVDKFGEKVGEIAEKDPVKARKLLLAGYRLQEKRLALFPDRKLPMSGQYVAKIVMNNIIQALAKPENAAMVSIFVPGELLTAAGLTHHIRLRHYRALLQELNASRPFSDRPRRKAFRKLCALITGFFWAQH